MREGGGRKSAPWFLGNIGKCVRFAVCGERGGQSRPPLRWGDVSVYHATIRGGYRYHGWAEQSPAPTDGCQYRASFIRVWRWSVPFGGTHSASDTPRSMSGMWSQCPWGSPALRRDGAPHTMQPAFWWAGCGVFLFSVVHLEAEAGLVGYGALEVEAGAVFQGLLRPAPGEGFAV